jgi:hypothetical protein
MKTTIETTGLRLTLDGKEYDVVVTLHLDHDPSYGADADGNRGEPRTFVSDIDIVSAEDPEEDQPVELTEELACRLKDAAWREIGIVEKDYDVRGV